VRGVQIGPYSLRSNLVVAPMAGVTDRPFRRLCKAFGAGMAISEMVASNPALRGTAKTQRRMDHAGEVDPVSVQIAGADPLMLADAARFNVDRGAQIIDINMGCPAKKVCSVAAGSALLRDEPLVVRILEAVVGAVGVPVTLKIRTGWDRSSRNAVRVAQMAEAAGVRAIAIHGRTRADAFAGEAEYDTIAEVKSRVGIPVIANGDIDTPHKAREVLVRTGADAIMIGRAAQGRPWIFRDIAAFLETGELPQELAFGQIERVLADHLAGLYSLYGEPLGVRVARKHVGWTTSGWRGASVFRHHFNRLETASDQLAALADYMGELAQTGGGPEAHAREELAA